MIEILQRNIVRFIFVVILQILLFRNFNLFGFIDPFFYLLFIILIPFETPKSFLLISAFFLGLSIDVFTNTIGIHASASVFVAYLRPMVLQYFAPRDGYEINTYPRIKYYGLWWFVRYAGIIVLLHSLVFFFVDAFGFEYFFRTLLYSALNAFFTLLLIVLSQYLIYKD